MIANEWVLGFPCFAFAINPSKKPVFCKSFGLLKFAAGFSILDPGKFLKIPIKRVRRLYRKAIRVGNPKTTVMKKIIFLLATSVLGFQVAGISQTRVGITGGVAVADMHGSEAKGGSSRAGFMTGFVVETPIGKVINFRPSVSYVQKGKTLPHPQGTLVDKYYIALRYTEFNADFLYYVGGNKGGFFLGAGPSIAFNLPSKRVSITDDVRTNSIVQFGSDAGSDLRGTDWGANFTTGWRTNSGFLISANYNKGFRNLVPEGNTGELKNSYFGIQLGVFLNNK